MNGNLQTNTCDADRLESYLNGELNEVQELEFTAHLDQCEPCRRSLELRAADPEAWSEAEQLLKPFTLDAEQLAPSRSQAPQIQQVLDALAPTDDPAMLGRLGGYEVSGVVGAGGMGVVLKAVDKSLDRTVAIRVLAPHLATSGAARKRFAREAKAAAAVLHPNVIAIHSVSNDEALPYLVMPYVRGASLQKRLDAEGPLAVTEILRIGSQIAAGLSAAHAQGLVHRDIKPANILLEDGIERVAITDFGLARAVDDATITRSGVIAGTPQYMSPEQARGESFDQRSDLFSLGSVLYAICTGRPPFRAETTFGVMRRITDDEPKSIREINSDIPDWLCAIVSRLMSKRASDRFESAEEVQELLEQCLAHVQQPDSVPLPESLVPQPSEVGSFFRSHRTGVIAMLGVFGFSLLGMLFWQGTEPPDIAGTWIGDEWGTVVLEEKRPGQYEGTYTETVKSGPGTIRVQWSRIERRFNGTWREGDDRFGKISVRLVDDEIRGGWTTNRESEINPGTPELADLLWTRSLSPGNVRAGEKGAPVAQFSPGGAVAYDRSSFSYGFDCTLSQPRHVVLGVVQYIDEQNSVSHEISQLGFYFASPQDVLNARAQVTWSMEKVRLPPRRFGIPEVKDGQGDWIVRIQGKSESGDEFDRSVRLAGKQPFVRSKALPNDPEHGPLLGLDPATTTWDVASPERPFRFEAGKWSPKKAGWHTESLFEASDEEGKLVGRIQVKLLVCPMLPDAKVNWTKPILQNGDWKEDQDVKQAVGAIPLISENVADTAIPTVQGLIGSVVEVDLERAPNASDMRFEKGSVVVLTGVFSRKEGLQLRGFELQRMEFMDKPAEPGAARSWDTLEIQDSINVLEDAIDIQADRLPVELNDSAVTSPLPRLKQGKWPDAVVHPLLRNTLNDPPEDTVQFRYLDFDVKPNRFYRYRVRLEYNNPDYDMTVDQPSDQAISSDWSKPTTLVSKSTPGTSGTTTKFLRNLDDVKLENRFEWLIEQRQYKTAAELALEARELAPDESARQMWSLKSKFAKQLEQTEAGSGEEQELRELLQFPLHRITDPQVPHAVPPPTPIEVIRELERNQGLKENSLTDSYERNAGNFRVIVEPVYDKVDPPRVLPLVGRASLHRVRFKCTVYYTEANEEISKVFNIDRDHLHVIDSETKATTSGRNVEQPLIDFPTPPVYGGRNPNTGDVELNPAWANPVRRMLAKANAIEPGPRVPAESASRNHPAKLPEGLTKEARYCLLKLGDEKHTDIWLIQDRDWLYVDLNGDGDLSSPDERFVEKEEQGFSIPEITSRGYVIPPSLQSDPEVRGYFPLRLSWQQTGEQNLWVRLFVEKKYWQESVISASATKPEFAPILHFDGPLRYFLLHPTSRFTVGETPLSMAVAIGTVSETGDITYVDLDEPPLEGKVIPELTVRYYATNDSEPREIETNGLTPDGYGGHLISTLKTSHDMQSGKIEIEVRSPEDSRLPVAPLKSRLPLVKSKAALTDSSP